MGDWLLGYQCVEFSAFCVFLLEEKIWLITGHNFNLLALFLVTQLTITCSNSTIETLEKGVDVTDVLLVILLLTLNIFHTFF